MTDHKHTHRVLLIPGGVHCRKCGKTWMAAPSAEPLPADCEGAPQPRWPAWIEPGQPLIDGLEEEIQHYIQLPHRRYDICTWCGATFFRPHPHHLCRRCAVELPHHFQHEEAIAWARKLLASTGWRLFSLEASGKGAQAEIAQAAVIEPDGTKLCFSDVRMAACEDETLPIFSQVYEHLHGLLTDQIVVAYDAPYHNLMLERACQRHGLSLIRMEWQCLMLWYARYNGEWNPYNKNFQWQPAGRGGNALDTCQDMLRLIHGLAQGSFPWLVKRKGRIEAIEEVE